MKRKLPSWAALLTVCLLAGGVVLGANRLTADSIARQKAAAKDVPLARVLPGVASFEPLEMHEGKQKVDAAYAGLDADGETVGYVGRATVKGYGGPVEVLAGLDATGTITGVSVGGEAFAETPGLGERTRESAFTGQFAGRTPEIKLGEGVDAVGGATITSRAVVNGVNSVADYFYDGELGIVEELAHPGPAQAGQVLSASRQGYGGDVTATVSLASDGTIEALTIDTPNETDGLGKRCSEPEFARQFIGKTGPFAYGEDGVEAVSGATITSTAALDALNEIVQPASKPASASVESAPDGAGGDAAKYMRPRR